MQCDLHITFFWGAVLFFHWSHVVWSWEAVVRLERTLDKENQHVK